MKKPTISVLIVYILVEENKKQVNMQNKHDSSEEKLQVRRSEVLGCKVRARSGRHCCADRSEDLKQVRSHVPISRLRGGNSKYNGLDRSWFGRFWK